MDRFDKKSLIGKEHNLVALSGRPIEVFQGVNVL